MGLPIGRRLAASGWRLHVVDSDPARRALAADYAATTSSRWDPDSDADIVLTVLPDAQAFAAVALGEGGIAQRRGRALWVDLTSNEPRFAERAAESWRPGPFVGAPMGGGPGDAARGTLSFWVAGADAARGLAMPLLHALAQPDHVHHVGDAIGAGYEFKLISNALWFGQVTAVSEAIAVAARLGIAPDRFAALLGRSPARSAFTEEYLPRLLEGDYAVDFGLAACVDELEIVSRLAEATGVRTPTMDATLATHRRARQLFGDVEGEMLAARIALDQRDAVGAEEDAPS